MLILLPLPGEHCYHQRPPHCVENYWRHTHGNHTHTRRKVTWRPVSRFDSRRLVTSNFASCAKKRGFPDARALAMRENDRQPMSADDQVPSFGIVAVGIKKLLLQNLERLGCCGAVYPHPVPGEGLCHWRATPTAGGHH